MQPFSKKKKPPKSSPASLLLLVLSSKSGYRLTFNADESAQATLLMRKNTEKKYTN